MSPFAPQVVVAAFAMSSPVFYQVLVARTAPLDMALTRFLVIWVITWIVVSLVVELLFPSRLETERRMRDLALAEREVRRALEEADAEAAREEAERSERDGIASLDALLQSEDDAATPSSPHGAGSAEPAVPPQRSAQSDQSAGAAQAAEG